MRRNIMLNRIVVENLNKRIRELYDTESGFDYIKAISVSTGISENRIKKILSGATDTKIMLNDLEKLAIALKVEALDIVTKRGNN